MKNRKKILMSSLVMLIVATVALSTTTYAWFTTGSTGTIDTFNFTADSASGIQFSLDAENWKSTITSADITAAVVTAGIALTGSGKAQEGSLFDGSKFTALSTTANTIVKATGSEDGKLVLYKAEAGADGGLTTSASTSGYYVFNVYVNNLSETAQTLQLTSATVDDYTGTTASTVDDKDTSTAVRIAFVDQGTEDKSANTAAKVKSNVIAKITNDATKVNIYEPNAKAHTGYAKTYLSADTTNKTAYYGVENAGTVDVSNIDNGGFIKAGTTDKTTTSTVITNTTAVTTFDGTSAQDIAALGANSITKLTVYVWIEGQDIDCYNVIASGQVSIKLTFGLKSSQSPS